MFRSMVVVLLLASGYEGTKHMPDALATVVVLIVMDD